MQRGSVQRAAASLAGTRLRAAWPARQGGLLREVTAARRIRAARSWWCGGAVLECRTEVHNSGRKRVRMDTWACGHMGHVGIWAPRLRALQGERGLGFERAKHHIGVSAWVREEARSLTCRKVVMSRTQAKMWY